MIQYTFIYKYLLMHHAVDFLFTFSLLFAHETMRILGQYY